MRVAVVTPYYREDLAMLRRCHESVLSQTAAATHIMVADGHPQAEVGNWEVQHMILPQAHGDFGNTPRSLGSLSALNQGFDAVAYLDADNWYAPEHIESLIATVEEQFCEVAFSDRVIVLSTGEVSPFEEPSVLTRRHVDTSCFFITKRAAHLLAVWALTDPVISQLCDRVMLAVICRNGVSHAWSGQRTLFYESRWGPHFAALGKPPPEDLHSIDIPAVRRRFEAQRSIERLGFNPWLHLASTY